MQEIFKIFKIDLSEVDKIAGQVNNPHYHSFEELLIGTKGNLEHFIDFQSQTIDAPFVSFVAQGKIHRVRPLAKEGQCDIWCIRFKSEFIANTTFQLYSSFHNNANICMENTPCFERLDTLCRILHDEYQQAVPDFSVMRDLLSVLFTIIESERNKLQLNNDESKKIQSHTFVNFLRLLDQHYKESRDVQFYADKLFMSTRNLNLICRKILQQSVTEIIETRKLTEAKNLLITTDMTIAEIGFEIGYKEKAYFTHAFKKKTGVTPSDFRKEMSKTIAG